MLGGFCIICKAQTFHKTLKDPQNLFSQRILRLEDGSYFIGDSFLTEGEIYISHFFKCGDLDWSRAYKIEGAFAEFRDFITTSEGDLVVFGSYFVGNSELIFVQKIDPENGVQISFNTYDPVFQDHFTYSIDIRDGEIMLYGLLLDFRIEKRGFLAALDENLSIKWAQQFEPFEKEGHAEMSEDGFFSRSGKYHFRFDKVGEVIWTKVLESPNDKVLPIGGPFRVEDGNIYEASVEGQSFFYKLDDSGNVIWQSKLFGSTGFRSDLLLQPDGSILVSFYASVNNSTALAQMKLSSAGTLSDQRFIVADKPFASGTLQVSKFENLSTIVGSPEPFTNFQNSFQDFVIQMEAGADPGCHDIEMYDDLTVNSIEINLEDITFDISSLALEKIASNSITFKPNDIAFDEVCKDSSGPFAEEEVLLLQCGSDVELSLPSDDYAWDDLGHNLDRTVSEPGIYTARSVDCSNTTILNFDIQSPNCECKVYFPTAISPNSDGFNDQLEYFSDCQISAINLSVYNRWGEQVFKSNVVGQFWQAEIASSGVYIVSGKYEVRGPNGEILENEFSQSVTVLK
jgi:hypothetical protein